MFNSCWTGKHKTGALICDECNASFGSEVDLAFKSYTKYQMNVWSLKGEPFSLEYQPISFRLLSLLILLDNSL
ncbi:hypothetical protein [Paenibacillus sp. 481]|uniref:hypothetical protein n=1 Tax=Paenibacillus sp. 481 TaxID=2835869 RepID=UPI003FA7D3DE|nr:hypothetical protein KIK04_22250 [Paenibacillus sp. 481]